MPATLRTITFETAPRMPGVRPGALSTIECDNPSTQLIGWKASIRGASVFFISPPGWKIGRPAMEWDSKGSRTMFEVPRIGCYFTWDGDEGDIAELSKGKFDTPPFGDEKKLLTPPSPGPLSKLEASMMGDA